ncbi:BTAD domain-containing putative transcriptional regulator [Leptospira sarikeiensis]|uniref:Transcriptional regulator n=1 Tax=Leptospira sarikeiensis TaxID=2484943 RepID=A0A4R9K015_9LEPT|nr:BTAD domain-containing putative transcriptional regulator [Leptospira sarikeiensis]TGL58344.1 transcriptional regulator [Leptospira sarikeiensis]
MTYYQLSCYLVVTVLVYRTIHNLVLYLRNRKQAYLLYFALLQVAYGAYLFCFIQTINAESPEKALIWERTENATSAIFATFIALFVNSYKKLFSKDFIYLYVFMNLILAGILLQDPNAYTMSASHPKHFPSLGIVIYETDQPTIMQFVFLSSILLILWTVTKVTTQFLKNRFRNRFLLYALVLFFASLIADILVASDLLGIPYTSHFSFLVLMFSVDSFLTVNKSEREVRIEFKESVSKWLTKPEASSFAIQGKNKDDLDPKVSKGKNQNAKKLNVRALGPLELDLDGKKIPAAEYSSKKKLLKLIKLLMVRFGKGIHKEELLENLWPGMSEKNALNSLHALLFRLRKILGNPEAVVFAEDRLFFHQDLVEADFVEFEKKFETAGKLLRNKKEEEAIQCYREAQELYTGDFFEFDLYFPESELKREYLRKNLIEIYRILCEFAQKSGDSNSLLSDSESWIRLDDLDERAWRFHFESLQALDRKNEALRKFEDMKKILKKELGVEPDQETVALIEKIRIISPVS